MDSSKNTPDFFTEIKQTLDALSDPGRLKTLSAIEVDLVKDRLRALYDRLAETPPARSKKEAPVEVELEVPAAKPITPAAIEEGIQQSETDPVEIESEELLSARVKAPVKKEKTREESGQPSLFAMDAPAGKQQPGGEKRVIDVIADDKKADSVADKLQKQSRVENLKKAIGINEKFFLINELFEGNLNAYNTAIESLDKCTGMDEAEGVLETLSEEFKWQGHEEAVGQLKQFLVQKFQ